MGLPEFSARSRMAASYVRPAASDSGMNGRRVIVGCLQQCKLTI